MKILEGKSVFDGVTIGRIHILKKEKRNIICTPIEDVEEEIARKNKAVEETEQQLKEFYKKALQEVGEAGAAIFETHQIMIRDREFQDMVEDLIRTQKVNTEYAVAKTADHFARMFEMMDDDYMKARAADVRDISERLLAILSEETEDLDGGDEAEIIVAEELSPSETVQMDKQKVRAFVTYTGAVTSHTAILARTMNIPALFGISCEEAMEGKIAVVDGFRGLLIVEPDGKTLLQYVQKEAEEKEKKELLLTLKGKETVTKSGKAIQLYANIGGLSDLRYVLQNDAAGIGLFRSEFLYLEKSDYPTEEEQFQIYKSVAQTMAGKKVIIRTLDIGADKQIDYFDLKKEENPAMGFRAIRICLKRPEIFKTQLRALYRASVYGNIAIMFPMITSVWEIRKIKEIIEEVKAELRKEDIPYHEMKLGVMIETPAAVMVSEELAKEVQFFSIGTNDLTQYTLAVDRQNGELDDFYDAHHPAVLKMIQMVIENGHKQNIWVGICGELGADLTLTDTFLNMGIDELSVSPSRILPIRRKVREHQ